MKVIESTAGTVRKCRGIVDGTNKHFGVNSAVKPYSLVVYLNGVLQTEGIDYVVTWELIGNIEFIEAPKVSPNPEIVTFEYEVLGT